MRVSAIRECWLTRPGPHRPSWRNGRERSPPTIPARTDNRYKASYKDKWVYAAFPDTSNVDTVLNEIGQKQSRLVAKSLESVTFARAFSSPLKRALQVPSLPPFFGQGLQGRHTMRLHDTIRNWIVKYIRESKNTIVGVCKGLRNVKVWPSVNEKVSRTSFFVNKAQPRSHYPPSICNTH